VPDAVHQRVQYGKLAALSCLALLALGSTPAAFAHQKERHEDRKEEAPAPAQLARETPGDDHAKEAADTVPAHPYPPEGVPRPAAWLGKFHPPATHFPVALLASAAFAELLLLRAPGQLPYHAVRFCVWVGGAGAVVTALLGWFFAGFRFVDDEWVMTAHRWFGTGTALWAVLTLFLCERAYRGARSRRLFRVALFGGAALVTATGFLGGSLVYGLDHYAW